MNKENVSIEDKANIITSAMGLRQLTPIESLRLMGVKDADINNIMKNQSDASAYHLAGDSIVVPVLQHIFDKMYTDKIIINPLRLVETFAGYGSQNLALKYSNHNFESWKIAERAYKSIIAYKDLHHDKDMTDYSKNMTKEEIVEFLFEKGISADYNNSMTKRGIKSMPEDKLRMIYNGIIASNNLVDITKVRGEYLDIRDTDKYDYLLTYSFPCQDLSAMGKKKGYGKDSGTRSGLLWEVERILTELKETNKPLPKILLMENVTQVHGKANMADFEMWLKRLEELGYTNSWQDLRASDYGVPQRRNRTFMVSILGDTKYEFPKPIPLKTNVYNLLEPDKDVDDKFFLTKSWQAKYIKRFVDSGKKGYA